MGYKNRKMSFHIVKENKVGPGTTLYAQDKGYAVVVTDGVRAAMLSCDVTSNAVNTPTVDSLAWYKLNSNTYALSGTFGYTKATGTAAARIDIALPQDFPVGLSTASSVIHHVQFTGVATSLTATEANTGSTPAVLASQLNSLADKTSIRLAFTTNAGTGAITGEKIDLVVQINNLEKSRV